MNAATTCRHSSQSYRLTRGNLSGGAAERAARAPVPRRLEVLRADRGAEQEAAAARLAHDEVAVPEVDEHAPRDRAAQRALAGDGARRAERRQRPSALRRAGAVD